MKTRLRLLVTLLMAIAMSTQVKAEGYGFKINGTEVTTTNFSDVLGDGKVIYDYTLNILRMTNVSFDSSNTIIENNSCPGLTVVFDGTNTLKSSGDQTVYCNKNTTFTVKSGTTSICGGNKSGIRLEGLIRLQLETIGDGFFRIDASNIAIQGNSSTNLDFVGGKFQIYGPKGNIVDMNTVQQYVAPYDPNQLPQPPKDLEVQLKSTFSGYPSVVNVAKMKNFKSMDEASYQIKDYIIGNSPEKVLVRDVAFVDIVDGEEYYDYFDENAKSILNSGGPVSGREINITNKYVAAVNKNFFPDEKFGQSLFNTYGGAWITKQRIEENPSLNVINGGISSLEGIQLLTDLKNLYCSYNNLTSLDLSKNENLVTLYCDHNQLKNLSLPIYSTLQYLYCGNNNLTSLSNIYNLKELECNNNSFTNLSVEGCSKLIKLNCGYNYSLTSLTLPSTKTSLKELSCNNTGILYLHASSYTNLVSINCLYMNSLKSVDVSGCTNLEGLMLVSSQKLTSLNVSSCTKLNSLVCMSTGVTSLDLSRCTALQSLSCRYGKLESLNISDCTQLVQLLCDENQLTSLTLPNSPGLTDIDCSLNQIQGSAMDALFNSLPNRNGKTSGSIKVFSNTSNEQNVCYSKHVNVAKSKNWDTYQYVSNNWVLYEGATASIATDLQAVETNNEDDNAPRYNMSGQRVGKDYKGIVVHNGKKVEIK